ncbi:MAG: hypothetical protein D6743_14545 [Calditrichaeota bacterium]|nr:MAG: hypothetical protein D6743_14545 [Calditrichota bacterium]
MIGKIVLHYKILEKLKRDMAIKFLPRQIATKEDESRLLELFTHVRSAMFIAEIRAKRKTP